MPYKGYVQCVLHLESATSNSLFRGDFVRAELHIDGVVTIDGLEFREDVEACSRVYHVAIDCPT